MDWTKVYHLVSIMHLSATYGPQMQWLTQMALDELLKMKTLDKPPTGMFTAKER